MILHFTQIHITLKTCLNISFFYNASWTFEQSKLLKDESVRIKYVDHNFKDIQSVRLWFFKGHSCWD